jgi:anthranilate phosphoribosyltransferase
LQVLRGELSFVTVLESLTTRLNDSTHLASEQVRDAVAALTAEGPPETKADFLTALARKGETVEEIAAFAAELRGRAVEVPVDAQTRSSEILDVCGTGGDRLNTFNISTTVALVVAGAGVTVAKHGNRAITSKTGSADVIEALGIRVDLSPAQAAAWLRDHQFAFFFAPNYHPAFKHIGPARKLCAERGQRTIFNFLGPLLNPARPSSQLIGVPRPELCETVARVLQMLGIRRGMVVSGCVGTEKNCFLDELSTLGPTTIAEFYQERGFNSSSLSEKDFPLQNATLADLAGTDRDTNAALVRATLEGKDRGPRRDAVLLNAAAALLVAGRARTLDEGWTTAAEVIDNGRAAKKLRELQEASAR